MNSASQSTPPIKNTISGFRKYRESFNNEPKQSQGNKLQQNKVNNGSNLKINNQLE